MIISVWVLTVLGFKISVEHRNRCLVVEVVHPCGNHGNMALHQTQTSYFSSSKQIFLYNHHGIEGQNVDIDQPITCMAVS